MRTTCKAVVVFHTDGGKRILIPPQEDQKCAFWHSGDELSSPAAPASPPHLQPLGCLIQCSTAKVAGLPSQPQDLGKCGKKDAGFTPHLRETLCFSCLLYGEGTTATQCMETAV